MDSRRDFLKKVSLLSSGLAFPASIKKALAIDPAEGSTFYDAEHVVILMQENRSFDHALGSLRGVRGFNDPRAFTLPDGDKVWLQKNQKGETYVPFRMDMHDTKITWINGLPHSWNDQVDARNSGRYDQWLEAKRSGHEEIKEMPQTLGFHNRQDLPFYYDLADAFTVCDHNFCSSLTGTTPNRLYLWTGTIREKADFESKANVFNSDVSYDKWANWKTFPERLEENNISWKIYQNEISLPTGLEGDFDAWLANFTDNPIEWFSQYNVKFHPGYHNFIKNLKPQLEAENEELQKQILVNDPTQQQKNLEKINRNKKYLEIIKNDIEEYEPKNFEQLTDFQKSIHKKAFFNNNGDPHFRELESMQMDGKQSMNIPKGDTLFAFRKDVEEGNLPTVSWLVPPEKFSDHPTAPWFGAWYLSEVVEILTKNPEVWKKTIFILTYDENDGFFDHIPPYVAPDPDVPKSGMVSKGIDAKIEQVNIKHEKQRNYNNPEMEARGGPIGLGYRVPMIIASPWSRGGKVNSQVFDHTSVLQFLENFLSKKTNKNIKETNISAWRRAVCGDLTSVFSIYKGEKYPLPTFVDQKIFMNKIYEAKYKGVPNNFKALNKTEIAIINNNPSNSEWMPAQEKGTRPACALPYEVYFDAEVQSNGILAKFKTGKNSAGVPLYVVNHNSDFQIRNYAIKSNDILEDIWEKTEFENNIYHLKAYGPNGFYRAFEGNLNFSTIKIELRHQIGLDGEFTGNAELKILNSSNKPIELTISDLSYKTPNKRVKVDAQKSKNVIMDLSKSGHWYDFAVRCDSSKDFNWHFAGHIETGKESISDPAMGGIV